MTYILSLSKIDGEVTACSLLHNKMLAFGSSLKGTVIVFPNLDDFSEFHSQSTLKIPKSDDKLRPIYQIKESTEDHFTFLVLSDDTYTLLKAKYEPPEGFQKAYLDLTQLF